MPGKRSSRSVCRLFAGTAALPFAVFLGIHAHAQAPESAPASVPAGATAPLPTPAVSAARTVAAQPHEKVSAKQAREAEDAYLDGARHMERNDLAAAERSFARAVELNPAKQDYVLSLAVLREHHVTELVQSSTKARLLGDNAKAELLLAQARALDPENSVVTQHLAAIAPLPIEAERLPGSGVGASLGGPIELDPMPGKHSVHARGNGQDLMREVYRTFGIQTVFDPSVNGGQPGKLDLDDVDFATATHIAAEMTHLFAVPLQPKSTLVAKDTEDERERLQPQVEETIFLPGVSSEVLNELAILARNIFDLKQVTASPGAGGMLVRGDERTLRVLNATYADMLDGGSDVLLDVRLYEIEKTHLRNIGLQTPTSAGGFSVVSEALNLINANQTLIQQAVANGLLTLTGNPAIDYPKELALLLASGTVTSAEFTSLLGTVGTLSGIPLLGVYAGSGATFNLLLNSSDVRTLDDIQVRAGNGQAANFRSGTRYPVITATYSSGLTSGLASQLAGLTVNGSSVSSLLSQYLGSSSVSVPQIQYEDLGVTLKVTPRVLRGGNISMLLDLKVEALGGTSINSIPILNSRQLTSGITIPAGETALLASEVTRNETRAIQGVPGLSELPGFQGTDKSAEIDTGELLITITPHIVRGGGVRVASRRLSVEHTQAIPGGAVEFTAPVSPQAIPLTPPANTPPAPPRPPQ